MPIILFVGQGSTAKLINYQYINNEYKTNDFIEQLKKISHVIIPNIPYHNIYYYQNNDIIGWKTMFESIRYIDFNDIFIENYIKKFYDQIDNQKKYIIIGHSDGIYYAMEFAKLYPELVLHIISLDGSWISKELCDRRIKNWQKTGKIIKSIGSQNELDDIMEKIINGPNNDIYIKKILDHTRYEHTIECINKKYENIIKNIKYTVFRDFNSTVDDVVNLQFNHNALDEHNILSKKSTKYEIFWLIDAGHNIWFNDFYKKQIIKYILNIVLINKFIEKYYDINNNY